MKSQKSLVRYNITEIPDTLKDSVMSEVLSLFGQDIDHIDQFVACEDHDGYESIYCLLDRTGHTKLKDVFESCDVLIDQKDLTLDANSGKFNRLEKNPEFERVFQNFMKENLNIDYILDKISQFGKDSLTKEEEDFLKNY